MKKGRGESPASLSSSVFSLFYMPLSAMSFTRSATRQE